MRISFDCVADIYDRTRGFPETVMKQLRETMASELRGNRVILDAGVGTGRFAKPLEDNGFEVIGVDIARKMLEKAAEKDIGNLFLGDICSLPFKDKFFDATVCIGVLHLIAEWKTALQEICRVTRNVMVSRSYVHKNPMGESTSHLVKRFGYERRLGKAEWELRNLVKSTRSVFVASYEIDADDILTHLSQRAYSYQWEIPEDVNKKIVNELKSQFAGKVFHQELRLLIWNIGDLRAFCEKRLFSSVGDSILITDDVDDTEYLKNIGKTIDFS